MKRSGKIVIGIIVVVLIIWVISAGSNNKETSRTESMKIGVLAPFTGKLGSYGEDMKNALELAKKQLGEKGEGITFIYEDSVAEAKIALGAVEKLTTTDNVDFIIAGPGSSALLAVAPTLEKKGVPLVALTATPNLDKAGKYIFRALPEVGEEVDIVAREFIKKGYKKVAMIYDSSADSNVKGKDQFVELFKQLGGDEVIVQGYDVRSTSDFKSIFSSVKARKPEAIYYLGTDISTAIALPHARQVGVTVPIYGWAAAENPSLLQIAGNAAEGYIFTAFPFSCDLNANEYCSLYKAAYPNSEPLVYGVRSFDLLNIIASSTQSNDVRADFLNALTSKSYSGVSGKINFNEEGNVVRQDFIFKMIKDGKFMQLNN